MSGDAASFDAFRRRLITSSRPVGGPARQAWFQQFMAFVRANFGGADMRITKPGVAERMFGAEIAFPFEARAILVEQITAAGGKWSESVTNEVKAVETFVYADRLDAVCEFALETEEGYVTGRIKFRNAPFSP
ncbi:MAG: hypothetical protein ACK538_01575, partial [Armatimonadota bacterium]